MTKETDVWSNRFNLDPNLPFTVRAHFISAIICEDIITNSSQEVDIIPVSFVTHDKRNIALFTLNNMEECIIRTTESLINAPYGRLKV